MAPTEANQAQNMSPGENLMSLRGKCQPCPRDHPYDHHKNQKQEGDHHEGNQQHHSNHNDATSSSSSSSTQIQHKPSQNGKLKAVDKDTKKKPEDDPDSEEWEARLWSVGCKSATFTIFLYIYGNNMLLGKLPKDPRVESWLYMQSPNPTLLTCLAYIAFCTYLGPRIMKGRQPPAGLKHVMILYNAVQVVFSGWMFYEGGMAGWFGSYSFICQPCDFSNSPQALRMLNAALCYNLSKFFDFFDTIFFVLNKKYSHISLLHVTHHSLMPIGIWYGLRHEAGGQTTFFGFLNCFVHTVMYLYYLLAALGPRVRPYLWWKKYLTKLQMAQFITMIVHASVSVVSGCQAGAPLMRIIFVMAAIFQILFTDFYIKAYLKRASGKVKKLEGPVFCNNLNNFSEPAAASPSSIAPLQEKSSRTEVVGGEENQGALRSRFNKLE